VVYTPLGDEREIIDLMANLEKYLNDDFDNVDPLVKLAVYQFQSIHPFCIGNVMVVLAGLLIYFI
jgi:Fic family protein